MLPLVDGDVLRYEVGFACQRKDEPIQNFDMARAIFDDRIEQICHSVGATEPPILYIDGKGNFRETIAKKKGYKANRKGEKPFHFNNLTAYMKGQYKVFEAEGIESDDAMAMVQTFALLTGGETVICTRDKDLRQVEGWHYGWECGAQPEYSLRWVDRMGELELTDTKTKKLVGTGLRFFYAQVLMGAAVDNVPGLPQMGPAKTYSLLQNCEDELSLYRKVREQYKKVYEDNWYEELREQAYLVWMVRFLDDEGQPIMWTPPEDETRIIV